MKLLSFFVSLAAVALVSCTHGNSTLNVHGSQSVIQPVYNGFLVMPQRRGRVQISVKAKNNSAGMRWGARKIDKRVYLTISSNSTNQNCYHFTEYATNRSWGLQAYPLTSDCIVNPRLDRYLELARERRELKGKQPRDERQQRSARPEISKLRAELSSNSTYRNGRCVAPIATAATRSPKVCPRERVQQLQAVCALQAVGPKLCTTKMVGSDSSLDQFKANALCTAAANGGLSETTATSVGSAAIGDALGPVFGLPFKAIAEYLVLSDWALCSDRARHYCDKGYIEWVSKQSRQKRRLKSDLKSCNRTYERLAKIENRSAGPQQRLSRIMEIENELAKMAAEDDHLLKPQS